LTTVSTTYTAEYNPSNTQPTVPKGWGTTVTVCSHCGPKPTTLTLTKPTTTIYDTTVQAKVTLSVVPIPEKEYYSSMSVAGQAIPSSLSVVSVVPYYPAKPVAPASSAVDVKPVLASTFKPVYGTAVYGTAAPTGYASKTGSAPYVQYTGAANRLNVGAGVIGLAAVVLGL
jgi:chitinase